MLKQIVFSLSILLSFPVFAGNSTNDSFSQSKKYLKEVYADHRETIYCKAKFNTDNTIILPEGFETKSHQKRSKRIEWEHIVPAENFGRTFSEWRDGHPDCVDSKGKNFKGRKCAEKVNYEYRLMQADMHNLFPAIGSVNAKRSNFYFVELPSNTPNSFGSCAMNIQDKKAEPPHYAKGVIARTYFYMEDAYPRYKISHKMRKMLQVWEKEHPVDNWECVRSRRIEKIQGNPNNIVKNKCIERNLWQH